MKFSINVLNDTGSPWHKDKNYEIIVYTKGRGTFCSKNITVDVQPGMIMVVPPETSHKSYSKQDFERIYIQGELNQFFCFDEPVVIYDNSDNEGIFLGKMIYKNRHSDADYIRTLISAFAHFLVQNIKMENEVFRVIKNIIEVTENRFSDFDFNITDLLNNSGYSEDYIRAQFKKITGKTPIEYLTGVRINHACYLINIYKASLSLTEISEKCGYNDYIYFSRRFKEIMGISPRKYMMSEKY